MTPQSQPQYKLPQMLPHTHVCLQMKCCRLLNNVFLANLCHTDT